MNHRIRLATRLFLSALAIGAFPACGSDDPKPESGTLGTKCDPGASTPCAAGLTCTPRAAGGNFCTTMPGGPCDPKDADLVNGGCAESAECVVADGATEPTCLITEGGECDPKDDHCTNGMTCAEVESGGDRCFGEVMLSGQVTDTSDASAIEKAHVIALNEEGVAVTDVAETDVMGNYELEVPVVRNDDGTPVDTTFTLHAAAQDYQPFPSGVRVALPIQVSAATLMDGHYVVDSALTDVGLIPLDDAERSSISGTIVPLTGDAAGEVGGVLVVATDGDGTAFSGISDKAGNFTIFNVPAGDYDLHAYAADIQIESESVTVASDPLEGVELDQLGETTTTVHGNVQIVNAPGGSLTMSIFPDFLKIISHSEARCKAGWGRGFC